MLATEPSSSMEKDEAASSVPVRPGDAKEISFVSFGSTNKSSEDLPTPTDGGWGWAVLFAAFMINFVGKYNVSTRTSQTHVNCLK